MSVHDLVIGAIKGRSFHFVSSWMNSLDKSGFTGTKCLICYDFDRVLSERLLDRGYLIKRFNHNRNMVHVDRFDDMSSVLKHSEAPYRYVVFTDTTDVIFQSDPTVGLEDILADHDLAVCEEGIRYKNEEWGKNAMKQCYGNESYDLVKDRAVVNCGVIAGTHDSMEFFGHSLWSLAMRGNCKLPDQQALNLMLLDQPYKSRTRVLTMGDGYIAHLGCHPQAVHEYAEFQTEPPPVFLPNGDVVTGAGQKYAIVHQYNRVDVLKNKIWEKYWEAE